MELPLTLILQILILIPTSLSSSIQIHDITNNAGALLIQKGDGRVIAGFDRLLHVIDFTKFQVSLAILENAVGQLSNNSTDFSKIIQIKLREIKQIINSLHASFRSKRSINELGSAIKFVTGNLDAHDLQLINSNIDKIRQTENISIDQNNRQIKLNSKFENRINLINDQIKDQQNILKKIVNNENFVINENEKIFIIFQLDSFLNTLKDIENSIMLAKINVISKLILSQRELEIIAQEITNQGLVIHDLSDASSYLSTTAFYRGATLIISVNIPKLLTTPYKKIIIEPLPLFNRTAKIIHHTVFVNHQEVLAITSPCQENNQITICQRKKLKDISNNPCEARLLREEQGKCNFVEKPSATEIREISPGTLLVITVHQDVPINSTCGIKPGTLKGIHLVKFHNCSIFVNNELYENFEFKFQHPTILPLQPMRINTLQIDRHINVSELQELHLRNRQYLEKVQFKHQLEFASVSIAIVLLAVLSSFIAIKYRRFIKSGHCSGRAILVGEAVNNGSSTRPSTDEVQRRCNCTQTAQSAPSEVDDIGHQWNAGIRSTIGPSSLGERLGELGKRAGQLGL